MGAPVCEGRACAHRAVWRHHPARSRSDRKQFRSRAGLPRLSCGTDSSDGALMGGPGPVTFNLRWPGPVSICQGPSGGVGAAGRCEGAPRLSPGLPPPPCHLPGPTGTVPVQGGTAAVQLRNRFQRWRRHESYVQVHEIRRHRALMGGRALSRSTCVGPAPYRSARDLRAGWERLAGAKELRD